MRAPSPFLASSILACGIAIANTMSVRRSSPTHEAQEYHPQHHEPDPPAPRQIHENFQLAIENAKNFDIELKPQFLLYEKLGRYHKAHFKDKYLKRRNNRHKRKK